MAGAKEVRGKIASIKNTRKITKALEMVAASKMRKAQDRMRAARPYAEKVRKIIGHLRQVNLDYKHPFTLERPVTSVGIVVISTDRGLCGSLNLNLFKATLVAIREAQARGNKVYLCVIGSKALQFFCRRLAGIEIAGSVTHLGDRPHISEVDRHDQSDAGFLSGREGRSAPPAVAHNVFVNTMTQKGVVSAAAADGNHRQGRPRCRNCWTGHLRTGFGCHTFDGLLMRYVEVAGIPGLAVENVACEMAARAW